MTVNALAAVNAYRAAARGLDPAAAAPAATGPGQGSFSTLVRSALDGAAASTAPVETQMAALAQGKADVVDLVTAVAETELAVETLVSVRDRVIAAYQDILNMPI